MDVKGYLFIYQDQLKFTKAAHNKFIILLKPEQSTKKCHINSINCLQRCTTSKTYFANVHSSRRQK